MKKLHSLILAAAAVAGFTGCSNISHNANLFASGKYYNLGTPNYGFTYVNGTTVVSVNRENSETVVEANDGDGLTQASSAFKGIRVVKFRSGPQVTGYLVDLAKKSPDSAILYVNQMPAINSGNKAAWDSKPQTPIDVNVPKAQGSSSDTTKKESSTKDKVKDAIDKVKDKISGKDKGSSEPESTGVVKGDGTYKDLDKDWTIAHQRALAEELIVYADNVTKNGSGETWKDAIKDYQNRLDKLVAHKLTKTNVRFKWVTIKNGVISDMRWVLYDRDTEWEDYCPTCVAMDYLIDDDESNDYVPGVDDDPEKGEEKK